MRVIDLLSVLDINLRTASDISDLCPCPHIRGLAGIMMFHFSKPWLIILTTLLLDPPYITENLTGVGIQILKLWHCGDNQKVIQNQNSLLVKRQNYNTSPGDWPRKISPLLSQGK